MPEVYKKETGTHWPWRGMLLFLLPLPLVGVAASSFASGDSGRLVLSLVAMACLFAAATLNRAGLRAEAEFRRRRIASAPRTPRKTLAAALLACGTFVCAAYLIPRGIVTGAIAGVLAALGAVLAYGPDPRGHKGDIQSGHGFSTEEIVAALKGAEDKIAAIEDSARGIPNQEFGERIRRIADKARAVLEVIEGDPGDLRRARKFLNVYLDGAQSVVAGYARTHTDVQTEELEDNFRGVLETIETSFGETREKLLQDDVMDLDVQIEVLRTRLEREGVL